MSYTVLSHVGTGDLATAALQNALLDDLVVLKTSINDDGTLKDITEGQTFTPVLKFGAATTGITYSTQSGRYLTIGKRVFFTIDIVLTSKGSATGNATLTPGLPVATKNLSGYTVSVSVGWFQNLSSLTVGPYFKVVANATEMGIFMGSGGALSLMQETNFQNTSELHLQGHYETN